MTAKRLSKTVVVKIGSSTLTDAQGALRLETVSALVAEVCELQLEGYRMLLVSSGAVSSGMGVLQRRRPKEIIDLQAAAAVGQGHLFHTYAELFSCFEVVTAQVLLTAYDVSARAQYNNARNTLRRLLQWRVVPIINENDTTSTDELCFGDNDALAAQVALLVKADLLVLLTDIEGLYTANPNEDEEASLINMVEDINQLNHVKIGNTGSLGSGGMGSKIGSARIATSGGVETVIACGSLPGVLRACVSGEAIGTRFPARSIGLHDYKLWLLFGKPTNGSVVVDEGAAKAIKSKGSLLPVGVIAVEGEFVAGDAVMVADKQGLELAKGLVNYSSKEIDQVKGLQSSQVEGMLPHTSPEVIHRDYMVQVQNFGH